MSESRVPEVQDEYEDLLGDAEHRWRNRFIMLAVLAALVAVSAYVLWAMVLGDDGSSTPETQTATVERGSISVTVSTSGVVAAQSTTNLSFGQSGNVTAVNVALGQAVKQGDVLAEIESDTLQDSLTKAQVNLASAQTKLNQLLEGSTTAELASADQSLIQAQASYDKAQTALEDLLAGPTDEERDSVQQTVLSAQSQLAKAQSARTNLDSTWEDAAAAAEKAVSKAEDALEKAERAADNAAADYEDCQAAPPASDLTCRTALANKENTADAVESAEDDLDAAEDNLDELGSAPTSEDIESADAAVTSAELALKMANDKLAEVNAGATDDDVRQAQYNVDSAAAALTAAQAKRDETYQGADEEDIDLQRDQVLLAQLAASQAEKDLEDAQLIAPFDGTVAELNIEVGEEASGAGGAGEGSAIVLNTPDAVRISLTISESDVSDVEVGQSGIASFDAIENGMLPIVIESIGTNPTTTQGVVTYQAWASIRTERPAGAAGATPSAGGRERLAAVATDAKPLPGMNASLTIIVDQAQDVLTIPAHAIQSEGGNSVVEVQKEDGTTERVVVETGLTDGKNTEIVNGLEEGQTVVIPSTAGSAQSTQDTGTPFPGSRFPGGAPPGGGAP